MLSEWGKKLPPTVRQLRKASKFFGFCTKKLFTYFCFVPNHRKNVGPILLLTCKTPTYPPHKFGSPPKKIVKERFPDTLGENIGEKIWLDLEFF